MSLTKVSFSMIQGQCGNIVDYGPLNTSNDTATIQAAIDDNYGKSLFIPAGTYQVSNLTITGEINLIGEGYSLSQITQIAGSTGAVITIDDVRHPSMRHLSIAGTSTGSDCVRITGASSGNQFIDCFFTLAGRDGLHVTGTTDNVVVLDCIIEVCGRHGVFFDSGTTAGLVTNSRIVSNVGNGVVASGNVLNPGVKITENVFGGNVIGIQLINQYFNIVSDNTILLASSHGIELNGASYNNITGNIVNNNTGDGIHITEDVVISTYNNITDNNIRLNANGIYFDGTGGGSNNVANNVVINNLAVGIGIVGSGNNTILGNQVLGNGLTATPKYGIYLSDGGSGAASNNRIVGNSITNLGNGALQTTAIYNDSSASNTTITNNNIVATTPLNVAGGSILTVRDNQGYITESQGAVTIPSGSTSAVITHGLSVTPTVGAFTLTLAGAATNDPGDLFVTNLTSTQATLNCRNNPGATGLPIYWKASIY
jgi:parallel beta-helix repeat protein